MKDKDPLNFVSSSMDEWPVDLRVSWIATWDNRRLKGLLLLVRRPDCSIFEQWE
jgi:hypothetical protein